jgi:hypothetical protein
MNYSPKGYFIWDAWYLVLEGIVHVFHLQSLRPGYCPEEYDWRWFGHAMSRDLVHWEVCTPVLGPDPQNPIDNNQPWTGCVTWNDDSAYLFYTMRPVGTVLEQQRIGLALSSDCYTFQRYSGNPIIEPDNRWYATIDRPIKGMQDCRDLSIVIDPKGGWFGLYTARLQEGSELPELNCIACIHSYDLIHWEHLPPAFVPKKYCVTEVVDVFKLNDLYYLTLQTGNNYGNRGLFSDPFVTIGTIYAIAEQPQGPYHELDENVLFGANQFGPLSARSILFNGVRYILYTDHERIGATDCGRSALIGTLSTPKKLGTDNDHLIVLYSDLVESKIIEVLVSSSKPFIRSLKQWRGILPTLKNHWQNDQANVFTGEIYTGMDVLLSDVCLDNGILEVEVTIEQGIAAGLAFRINSVGEGGMILLDTAHTVIEYQEDSCFEVYREIRQAPILNGSAMHLRVVLRGEHIEAYLNNILYLAFPRYKYLDGQFGLIVDRSKSSFRNFRVVRLAVNIPWKET